MNELELHVLTWINLKNIRLSLKINLLKDVYNMMSFI